MDHIPLAEMLVGLRKELLEAQQQAANEKLKFKVEDIEVELKVGTTKKGAIKGGVKFWVVDAGAEGAIEAQNGSDQDTCKFLQSQGKRLVRACFYSEDI